MNYVDKDTGAYPLSEAVIKALNPNTSFTDPFAPPENYELVFAYPRPTFNPITETLKEGEPRLTNKGTYEQTWEIVSRFSEYTDARGVTHTVQDQIAAETARHENETAKRLRDIAKANRQARVEAIRVTTSTGKTFDGDEISQTRMARAIVAMKETNTPSTPWVLADNTPTTVSVAELVEALALAGAAQSAVWVIE